ncbi:MAG: pyrimidine-nucleoside phosphorylase [Bacteroidetes bacterium]|nr:pyrimidine-nucleoside phosphorylase [Bacteroidia bacterium]PCH69764.1 MAG: pyrimidine-nucleoside phosphorylase [Bacteroidota bacterium]
MRPYDIILKKRNGEALSKEEIEYIVFGYAKDEIMDYQISALMMAIYFQKLSKEETLHLTKAMINSGDVIDLSKIDGIKVDKHSTGGVGDKTSLVLGPMVAACGVPVAKLSGRGLGHTGGTIDKLESIFGFSSALTEEEFVRNVNEHGIAIGCQTRNLVPADKKFYALRDVTATIENISLIAGSIMSKKLASGAEAIVLDVKTGNGSFIEDTDEAFELAQEMVDIGEGMDKSTVALITDMDQPLGNSIGNSLEVIEAINSLQGNGPDDLHELCLALGSQMLILSKNCNNEEEARAKLQSSIDSGSAFNKFKEFVEAQGGNTKQIDDPEKLPTANHKEDLIASDDGFAERICAKTVGMASLTLGAGRETKESELDLSAGIVLHKKVGDKVTNGDVLATLYANDTNKLEQAKNELESAYKFSNTDIQKRPLIFGSVDKNGIIKNEFQLT